MRFEKWQALGNDYMIVERAELPFALSPGRIRKLCAGHFGVFADGILLLEPSEDPRFVAHLRIYNPDGSEAELSGNGAREAILYLRKRGWTSEDVFSIQTPAGEISPTITGPDTCKVDMGRALLASKDFPTGPADGRAELQADGRDWTFQHVSIGNPQCAIYVQDPATLSALDLARMGPAIEAHALFPNRTNVSWYTPLAEEQSDKSTSEGMSAAEEDGAWAVSERATIRARIFERGVGETLSSGTGASGAAVAHYRASGQSHVTVLLDGGQLDVEVGKDLEVQLTGWARPVFEGRLSDEFLKELDETE